MTDSSHALNGTVSAALAFFFGWYAFHGLTMRMKTSTWKMGFGTMVSQYDYTLFGYTYNCDVKYKYTVGKNVYNGTRTDNWESGTSPAICNQLSKFDEEDLFALYYDPLNPQESVIDNTIDPFYYSVMIGISVYDLFEALIYFNLSGSIPSLPVLFPMFVYMLVAILSVFWVGISNIQDQFASSLLAICGSLYFSAVIVKGMYIGFTVDDRLEQMSTINVA